MTVGMFCVAGALSCIGSAGTAFTIVSGIIIGIALISLSLAVWHQRQAAIQIGYSVIVFALVSFLVGAFQYGISLPPWERYTAISGSVIGGVLVCIYWAAVWRRLCTRFTDSNPVGEQDAALKQQE